MKAKKISVTLPNMNAAFLFGVSLFSVMLPSVQAQLITNTRNQADVNAGEATQAAELSAMAGTGFNFGIAIQDTSGIAYGGTIYPPPNIVPGVKYPLILCWGGTSQLAMPSSLAQYPAFVAHMGGNPPALPNPTWKYVLMKGLKAFGDFVITRYGNSIDTNRIYSEGFSKYGGVSWYTAEGYPDYFAAVLPSSSTMMAISDVPIFVNKQLAVWMFQGGPSDVVTNATP